MSRPKRAVKWTAISPATEREDDDVRRVSADPNGNRAQRRAAKRLGIVARPAAGSSEGADNA